MKILTGYQEALDYVRPFTFNITAAENTLKYIFEHLHHNCYIVCSDGEKAEVIKLESYSTAPSLRPYLIQKLNKTIKGNKRKALVNTLRSKEWRVMQCVIKPFKSSTDSLFPRFIAEIKVPRGVYVFSLTDAQILREDGQEPWQMVTGPKDLGKYKFSEHLPIFAYSGQKGYLDIPIPTYDDILLYFRPYTAPVVPWESKKEIAVFRGSPTGCGYTPETNQRIKLATMRSELLDAGLVETKSNGMRFDPVHGLGELSINLKKVSRIDMDKQAEYKYIIHVDGNVLAYRLLKSMLLGSVILRVKSPYVHWLDHVMKPGKHYIEIKEDLSDLEAMINWCIDHDAKCKKIAENAKKFAVKALSPAFMRKYFEALLR
jgi:hypothetical protein